MRQHGQCPIGALNSAGHEGLVDERQRLLAVPHKVQHLHKTQLHSHADDMRSSSWEGCFEVHHDGIVMMSSYMSPSQCTLQRDHIGYTQLQAQL